MGMSRMNKRRHFKKNVIDHSNIFDGDFKNIP
jgi:hypothetical protein